MANPTPTESTPPLSRTGTLTHSEVTQRRISAYEGRSPPFAEPIHPADKAIPWYRDRAYPMDGWNSPALWRSVLVGTVGTSALVLVSGQIGATLLNYQDGSLGVTSYVMVSNILLLMCFIYATAPASGGHLNPLISFSTMLTGICPLPRAVLYICGQTLGACIAGGVLTGVWGRERSVQLQGGGCFYDSSKVLAGQVFLNEVAASFALLFLAFGVGLDPRQTLFFGPRHGPVLVGMSLGLVAFASSGMIPGYTGAQMIPARCMAFGIVRRDLSNQWIWWFGPMIAALLLAVLHNIIPPHLADPSQPKQAPKGENVEAKAPA
ncbi:hypothetical protein OQA88_10972 [Cercophora sp. LCS_1]